MNIARESKRNCLMRRQMVRWRRSDGRRFLPPAIRVCARDSAQTLA